MPYADPNKRKEAGLKAAKKWRDNNKEKHLASVLKWQKNNPETTRKAGRKRYAKNPDKFRKRAKEFRDKNPNAIRARNARYKAKNPEKFRDMKRRTQARMLQNNLPYRIKTLLRQRLVAALKKKRITEKPESSTTKMLGCSIESFKTYLESRWETGMTWDNYGMGAGTWQIDHIMPCAIFDLSNPNHLRICFHFSNLQPLWSVDNNAKGAKVTTNQFQLL